MNVKKKVNRLGAIGDLGNLNGPLWDTEKTDLVKCPRIDYLERNEMENHRSADIP
jgi:hypothetical protein